MPHTGSALLIVDVQRDFCTGGSLAVPEGEGVVPSFNGYIAHADSLGSCPTTFREHAEEEDVMAVRNVGIHRILCPVDFSDFSRRALDHAVAIARWYGATVTLLYVSPVAPAVAHVPGAVFEPRLLTPESRELLLGSLTRFAETEAGSSVPLTFELAEGQPAAEVLARASASTCDLVVMGTHGRSGFERLALGSVTEKVLRKATCPVLSVPTGTADAVPAPPVLFSRILCAIDFSDCSLEALRYATSLADEAHAQLTVAHVVELPIEASTDRHETVAAGPRSLAEFIAAELAERRARLDAAVAEYPCPSGTVETVLRTGKAYREILRLAAERASELIIVGIHGRGTLDLMFFGSTTQHLVRQAPCPVLTLRPR